FKLRVEPGQVRRFGDDASLPGGRGFDIGVAGEDDGAGPRRVEGRFEGDEREHAAFIFIEQAPKAAFGARESIHGNEDGQTAHRPALTAASTSRASSVLRSILVIMVS